MRAIPLWCLFLLFHFRDLPAKKYWLLDRSKDVAPQYAGHVAVKVEDDRLAISKRAVDFLLNSYGFDAGLSRDRTSFVKFDGLEACRRNRRNRKPMSHCNWIGDFIEFNY
ncbi:hypothetical protein DFP90_1192 [Aestuariispira insulae]|uniref:Uncharacterized protein n=1 Tax=Aestuariispira insulae TaxID=1461337 RepID=A0A3D9H2K8_9PROT|nr:hypothetical protein DFP90_1192 [Aestuariispira insulae]